MNTVLKSLVDTIKVSGSELKFKMLEIGARKINNSEEPFYELLDYFPGSEVIGFEVDEKSCEELNASCRAGVTYYPQALGAKNQVQKLFVTQHPMCCSLYEPNEDLLRLYHNFDVAYLDTETEIDVSTLDSVVEEYNLGSIDFIKADVQGAELDIFKGAEKTLHDVLKIVCEVEFIPHYKNQPLFGDVCAFLNRYDLMFNKFLGLGGEA